MVPSQTKKCLQHCNFSSDNQSQQARRSEKVGMDLSNLPEDEEQCCIAPLLSNIWSRTVTTMDFTTVERNDRRSPTADLVKAFSKCLKISKSLESICICTDYWDGSMINLCEAACNRSPNVDSSAEVYLASNVLVTHLCPACSFGSEWEVA